MPPAPEATYANHLVHEAQAVEAFIEILHQEQTALGQSPASFEHLMRHTEAKTQQAELISRLESSRKTLADACREAKSSSETDTELAQRLNCGELWARLSARVAEARIQNNINGLAIQNRLERTNSTLAFLRNQTSGSLYAANGRRQTVESGRLRAGA